MIWDVCFAVKLKGAADGQYHIVTMNFDLDGSKEVKPDHLHELCLNKARDKHGKEKVEYVINLRLTPKR